MRIVLILAALAGVAYVTNQKWLGLLVLLFIFGCSLFGVGEAVIGNSTLTAEGRRNHMRRHLQSLPPNFNPRYGTLRLRGLSHEECLRRGVQPTRPEDYFEREVAKGYADYKEAQRTGDYDWFTSPERLRKRRLE
jgi:hypothetical protein